MSLVVARTRRDVVTVSGADAASYLQGQVSQDVNGLMVGTSTWSFILAPQGKVDGWGRVYRTAADEFTVDVDAGAGAAWEARLRRFLMRTKAEISVRTDVTMLAVRALSDSNTDAVELSKLVKGGLDAGWPGAVGLDRLLPGSGDAGDAGDTDVAALVAGGAVEIDNEAYEVLRICAGIPRWGSELDADTIPATVGQWAIDASVSFTKGCYTGQELVARIDSRGGNVPRRLLGLLVGGAAPAPGAAVTVGGTPAGEVTSSAANAGTGSSVALVYVPRAVEVAAGGVDALVDGRPARLGPVPIPMLEHPH
ncbi:MAG: glycine cleavage T C-terminal barrel domain-containing protein [Aquihabitans sp.]